MQKLKENFKMSFPGEMDLQRYGKKAEMNTHRATLLWNNGAKERQEDYCER